MFEERRAKFKLKVTQLSAESRLLDIKLLRSLSQATMPRCDERPPQIAKLYVHRGPLHHIGVGARRTD